MGRVFLAAICGLVLAGAVSASAQQPPQAKSAADNQNAAADQKAPVRASEPESDRQGRANQAQTQQQPSPLEQSDLAAQWTMAGLAGVQMVLTFFGLLYIRWTLLETRKAVQEANDATEAARLSVTETSRIGEAQARAYLSVIGAAYSSKVRESDIFEGEVVLEFNNSGSTPAFNVSYFCGSETMTINEARVFECPDIVRYAQQADPVAANSTVPITPNVFGIASEVAAFKRNRDAVTVHTQFGEFAIIVVWGSVFYEDVFEQTLRSDFVFWLEPRDGLRNKKLKVGDTPSRTFARIVDRKRHIKEA